MFDVEDEISAGGLRFDLVGELLRSVNDGEGFMTGSAVIGGFTNGSDIDVVFPVYGDVDHKLMAKSSELGFCKIESVYNKGYKLVKNGSVELNIISLHPYDYCAWLFATNFLKEQRIIHDKFIRHRAFELAVTLFKLSNSSSNCLTMKGAQIYYKTNHTNELTTEFEIFVNRITHSSDLPF